MSVGIINKVKTADNLPSLPTVAMEVLRMTQVEDVSVADIAAVVQKDPALTGKILKVVNSSLFGMPREISSVQQAMMVLGLRTVKVMVLSFSLVDSVRRGPSGDFDIETFWRRSLTCSAAARLLSKHIAPRMAEEAFVGGLLADLGMIAAWRCAKAEYEPVMKAWTDRTRPLHEVELELLGVSHADLGRELLKGWSLPATLCEAVGAHHGQGLSQLKGPSAELGKVVFAAASIAALFCQDVPNCQLDKVKQEVLRVTGIQPQALEELLGALDSHVRDTASLLSVRVGETINYAQLQAEAAMQLAQLSMQAEMERAQSTQTAEQMKAQVNTLQQQNREIQAAAFTDALTRIANRAAFDSRLQEEINRASTQQHALSLIMLDVDHFKKFNDTYGHQAGDAVLKTVGGAIRDVCEDVGFAARYGGEEFAVIVAQQTAEDLRELAEEIRRTIEGSVVKHNGQRLRVTASVGATSVQPARKAVDPKALIEMADQLLYKAKRNGRNRVEVNT